jgi:hypothetical protein
MLRFMNPDAATSDPASEAIDPREAHAYLREVLSAPEAGTPLDLDAFERWAETGEGDPCKPGA